MAGRKQQIAVGHAAVHILPMSSPVTDNPATDVMSTNAFTFGGSWIQLTGADAADEAYHGPDGFSFTYEQEYFLHSPDEENGIIEQHLIGEKMQVLLTLETRRLSTWQWAGPFTYAAVQDEWRALPGDEFAKKIARQGVANFLGGEVAVLDDDYRQVPGDGSTMGEIGFRGNAVMKGYYREPEITEKAFAGGWFRSGDLGVLHDDGYIELRDRAKDIIISGGENISSIEVENTLASHPDIEEAAIVSMPNERWGEVPAAFVSPKAGKSLTEREVIDFCRERLAHYKCPQQVIFEPLPRTSTGKVQKYSLRERM
ncbi:MAG: AMP-binding protein, partial [Chloroflexi bacterium]|nr:AMP-binding protein [Chloroflexota bacterium]